MSQPSAASAPAPDTRPAAARWWQQRWLAWAARRHPASERQQLRQNSIYVLPTKSGWLLALTLLLLLLASMNFQLNLGYLLTFWLLASICASVWAGHRNMRGLCMHLGPLAPVFQYQNAWVPVQLQAPSTRSRGNSRTRSRTRYAIGVALHRPAAPFLHVDVPAGETCTAQCSFTPQHRGWQRVPRLQLQSLYPLGVFRLWSYWQPQAQVLVYPAPETPCPPIQQPEPAQGHASSTPQHSGSLAQDSVRPYQRGDRMRDIVWKKSAQTLASGQGELVVRSGQAAPPPQLWLDAQATGLSDPEAQIARLTAWVLHAHSLGSRWGLRLPSGTRLPPDSGEGHLHQCLQALALDGHI